MRWRILRASILKINQTDNGTGNFWELSMLGTASSMSRRLWVNLSVVYYCDDYNIAIKLGHVKQYATMHYLRSSGNTQSMEAYMISTEYLWGSRSKMHYGNVASRPIWLDWCPRYNFKLLVLDFSLFSSHGTVNWSCLLCDKLNWFSRIKI